MPEKKSKRKAPAAFMKKFQPSNDLAVIVGNSPLSRAEATKKIWEYIKKNNLQNGRTIKADNNLKVLFQKDEFSMFEIGGTLSRHLSELK